jgi:hypothetical protein
MSYFTLFCGILSIMPGFSPDDFPKLYTKFEYPITNIDCGEKCAPYNEYGVPFCCDPRHAIPTAYQAEWAYLQDNTNLWHAWQSNDDSETYRLRQETPTGHILIECLGYKMCQRSFRAITCRSFPFYPYITREGEFIGISYYHEYEDRCWVISNLDAVTTKYRSEFASIYDEIFTLDPQEHLNFSYHASVVRRIFGRKHRSIPLLHKDGLTYHVNPRNGQLKRIFIDHLPKYYPYSLVTTLAFPDEKSINSRSK